MRCLRPSRPHQTVTPTLTAQILIAVIPTQVQTLTVLRTIQKIHVVTDTASAALPVHEDGTIVAETVIANDHGEVVHLVHLREDVIRFRHPDTEMETGIVSPNGIDLEILVEIGITTGIANVIGTDLAGTPRPRHPSLHVGTLLLQGLGTILRLIEVHGGIVRLMMIE